MSDEENWNEQADQDLILGVLLWGGFRRRRRDATKMGSVQANRWAQVKLDMRNRGHVYDVNAIRLRFRELMNRLKRLEDRLKRHYPQDPALHPDVQANPRLRVARLADIDVSGITNQLEAPLPPNRQPAGVAPPRCGEHPHVPDVFTGNLSTPIPHHRGNPGRAGVSARGTVLGTIHDQPTCSTAPVVNNYYNVTPCQQESDDHTLEPMCRAAQTEHIPFNLGAEPMSSAEALTGYLDQLPPGLAGTGMNSNLPESWPKVDPLIPYHIAVTPAGRVFSWIARELNRVRNRARQVRDPETARNGGRSLMRLADSMILGIREWGGLIVGIREWMEQEIRNIYFDLGIVSDELKDNYNFGGLEDETWYGEAPYAVPQNAIIFHSTAAAAANAARDAAASAATIIITDLTGTREATGLGAAGTSNTKPNNGGAGRSSPSGLFVDDSKTQLFASSS
ncbi:hypothetical protein TruAng_001709 [Truncatella angustata]|nr:hypothetical protein TruAng_001709 [Truncatella angustata]